jgi:DNA mismatch repair ATPase MutL
MLTKRTDVVKFALCAALCGMLAISIGVRAQDQTPPPEHKQQDRAKNHTGETQQRSHAAQGQAREHQEHPEAQPRNRSAEHPSAEPRSAERRSAEHPSQERQNRPAEAQPRNSGARPENRGAQAAQGGGHRPAPNAHYEFRHQDVPRLRQHFQGQLAHVNRNNRPHLAAGAYLQGSWQTYIVPVPIEEFTYLPPVPEGYQMAFYDGYIIVYDPYSGLVLNVIDLFAY